MDQISNSIHKTASDLLLTHPMSTPNPPFAVQVWHQTLAGYSDKGGVTRCVATNLINSFQEALENSEHLHTEDDLEFVRKIIAAKIAELALTVRTAMEAAAREIESEIIAVTIHLDTAAYKPPAH